MELYNQTNTNDRKYDNRVILQNNINLYKHYSSSLANGTLIERSP